LFFKEDHSVTQSRWARSLKTLQELAGHHSPLLTARYSHRRLHDLAGAIEKLPNFLPGTQDGSEARALRTTGTEGQLLSSCTTG
jgi:hypothetical protein